MSWFNVGAAFLGAAGSAASAKSINRQSLAFAREQMKNKHQWDALDRDWENLLRSDQSYQVH